MTHCLKQETKLHMNLPLSKKRNKVNGLQPTSSSLMPFMPPGLADPGSWGGSWLALK